MPISIKGNLTIAGFVVGMVLGGALFLFFGLRDQFFPGIACFVVLAIASFSFFMWAAIAKSDGTRASVLKQVFSGDGITIPTDTSVLGKELKIDTKTGDVNAKDISVLIMKNNTETFLQAQAVK